MFLDFTLTMFVVRRLNHSCAISNDVRIMFYVYEFTIVLLLGCTDMKRMWFVSVGELPVRTIHDEWVDLKYLEKGM